MDTVIIQDLEVWYHVGVPESERASPQRLLLTLHLGSEFTMAAQRDDLRWTIDYAAVCERLRRLGEGRSWQLIETLAVEIAELVRQEFSATTATVEVKKFILPQTRYVAVRVTRPSADAPVESRRFPLLP